MTDSFQVRSSRVPLGMACAASFEKPALRIQGPRGPSQLGTAAHRVWTDQVRGFSPSIEEIAAVHGVDPRELEDVAGDLWFCWQQVAQHFQAPRPEVSMRHEADGLVLTGHADILSVQASIIGSSTEERVLVADGKTGWRDDDHEPQLRAYAFLGLQLPEARNAMRASAASLLIRQRKADWYHWTREELNAWWASLVSQVRDRETYRPGRHCGRCPHGTTCDAKTALLGQLRTVLLGDTSPIGSISDEDLGRFYDEGKLLEQVAAAAIEMTRAEVDRRGGRIQLDQVRDLELQSQRRTEIDFAKAWRLLADDFPDLVLAAKIGKGKLEEIVGQQAPFRRKGKLVAETMRRLDEVGALTETFHRQLRVTKHVRTIADDSRTAADPIAGSSPSP